MTTKTVKLIVFIALLVHGIGHFQGVAASLGAKINNSNAGVSWLLKSWGEGTNKTISLILFLITGILGILTALSFKGILINESTWQLMAVITALCSILCLILFPNSFAMFFNKVGAIGVNLFIYYSIVFNGNWPSVIFED